MKVLTVLMAITLLVGCGVSQTNTHGEHPPAENQGLNSDRFRETLPSGLSLVNALSGILQNLLHEGGVVATRIGEALPQGVEPLQLTGVLSRRETFEKHFESILGADLLNFEYEIEYQYGAHYLGVGSYIPNITFIPKRVEVDPFWSIKAVAVSEKPVNRGSAKDPIAEIRFLITFTLKGIGGTQITTDEFVLEGKTGAMKTRIRPFE